MHKLVGTLCRSAKGLSEEWARECTRLVAQFVPIETFVGLVLPVIRNDAEGGAIRAGSRSRSFVVITEMLNVTSRARLEPHAYDIAQALADRDEATTRDAFERLNYLRALDAFGRAFFGHANFMGAKGRLVSLGPIVAEMMSCAEIAQDAAQMDMQLGTEGADAAFAASHRALDSLHAIVVDPSLCPRASVKHAITSHQETNNCTTGASEVKSQALSDSTLHKLHPQFG